MTTEQAIDLVGRITYKPKSHISCHESHGSLIVHINHVVEDVHSGSPVTIGRQTHIRIDVLKGMSRSEFLLWLMKEIISLETHEVHEWLQVDGQPLVNPHPEKS